MLHSSLAAHCLRRRPRSLSLRLREVEDALSVSAAALGLVLAAIDGRLPQVRAVGVQQAVRRR